MAAASRGVIIRSARRDGPPSADSDAAGIAGVLNNVIAQKRYTALSGHWTAEAEAGFLKSLGLRSELFVADSGNEIVGFQVIEPFVAYTNTMDHVAHMGTYVHSDHRGQGIGRLLASQTMAFARKQGYEKVVLYVLAHNKAALAYYRGLGFAERGVLQQQTKIDGAYYDEVFMELLFENQGP
jgi:L-amino acid N-acyltransferase YncA